MTWPRRHTGEKRDKKRDEKREKERDKEREKNVAKTGGVVRAYAGLFLKPRRCGNYEAS